MRFHLILLPTLLCLGLSRAQVWDNQVIDFHSQSRQCPGIIGAGNIYAKFSSICADCQNVYRNKSGLARACREKCFRNEKFELCVDAVKLSHELKEIDMQMAELHTPAWV